MKFAYYTYIVNIVLALLVVSQLLLRFFLVRMWVKEKVVVYVSIVLDFNLALLAIKVGEVAIRARRETFRPSIAILRDLLIERIVAHHCYCSHGADWPEEESEEPLDKVQAHVLWHVILFVTVIKTELLNWR